MLHSVPLCPLPPGARHASRTPTLGPSLGPHCGESVTLPGPQLGAPLWGERHPPLAPALGGPAVGRGFLMFFSCNRSPLTSCISLILRYNFYILTRLKFDYSFW